LTWLGLLIVGVVLLIVAYYSPRMGAPPVLTTILNVVGWICVAIAIILVIAMLLGIAVAFPVR
jgi:hypothetical protein